MENNVNTRKEDAGKKKFNFADFLTLICLLFTGAVFIELNSDT